MFTTMLRAVKSMFAGSDALQVSRPNNRVRLCLEELEKRDCPAVLTVTGLGDAGAGAGLMGDFRYCIQQSNALAGADTINFQQGLTGTISTTSRLDITDSLTITGPGVTNLTVQRSTAQGTGNFGLVSVGQGISCTISGLAFSNGRTVIGGVSGGHGGAINN